MEALLWKAREGWLHGSDRGRQATALVTREDFSGVHACTALCGTEAAEVPPALLGFTYERLGPVSEGLDLDSGSPVSGLSAQTGMQ